MTATDTKEKIALLNDALRASIGHPVLKLVPGMFVQSAGIAALPPDMQVHIWERVRRFDDFSEDNDPHGERDFGAFDIQGIERIFWRIDYYADARCEFGSLDPADVDECFRVLTVMLATEY